MATPNRLDRKTMSNVEDLKNTELFKEHFLFLRKKEKLLNSFWQSPIFEKLVSDIKNVDKPFTSYEWKNFPEKLRGDFYWGEDVYSQHIEAMMMCLSSSDFPKDKPDSTNEQHPFPNILIYRKGLKVTLSAEENNLEIIIEKIAE